MTYRKPCNKSLLCHLVRLIRHLRWNTASKPLSWHIERSSYRAVTKHWGRSY